MYPDCSVVEEYLGPLSQLIPSLVEIFSLVQSSGPLNELVVLRQILEVFLSSEIGVIEFLLPSLHLSNTVGIEEPWIGCLELALTWVDTIESSLLRHIHSLFLGVLLKSEWVNSVWAAKEVVIFRIRLNVFPSGVGPPAWNELEVFFWWLTISLILAETGGVIDSGLILGSSSDWFSSASKTSLKILWACKLFYVIWHSFSKNKLLWEITL